MRNVLIRHTAEQGDADGGIFVRAVGRPLDPEQPLIYAWRDGDVW